VPGTSTVGRPWRTPAVSRRSSSPWP
jgi:hypothetical protein